MHVYVCVCVCVCVSLSVCVGVCIVFCMHVYACIFFVGWCTCDMYGCLLCSMLYIVITYIQMQYVHVCAYAEQSYKYTYTCLHIHTYTAAYTGMEILVCKLLWLEVLCTDALPCIKNLMFLFYAELINADAFCQNFMLCPQLPKPAAHPMMLAYKTETPADFVLRTLQKIKSRLVWILQLLHFSAGTLWSPYWRGFCFCDFLATIQMRQSYLDFTYDACWVSLCSWCVSVSDMNTKIFNVSAMECIRTQTSPHLTLSPGVKNCHFCNHTGIK